MHRASIRTFCSSWPPVNYSVTPAARLVRPRATHAATEQYDTGAVAQSLRCRRYDGRSPDVRWCTSSSSASTVSVPCCAAFGVIHARGADTFRPPLPWGARHRRRPMRITVPRRPHVLLRHGDPPARRLPGIAGSDRHAVRASADAARRPRTRRLPRAGRTVRTDHRQSLRLRHGARAPGAGVPTERGPAG